MQAMAAGMTRLYGPSGRHFMIGKNDYRSVNGVLDVPQQLVETAQRNGFSLMPTAPAVAETDGVAVAVATEDVPNAPATQFSGVPAAHPMNDEAARVNAREESRATERKKSDSETARGKVGGRQTAGGGPQLKTR